MAAHLDKLADEGRLPAGVQRPDLAVESRRLNGALESFAWTGALESVA
jgi:hypothetical protein